MNDKTPGDDRSMNEILASIRKIVSDEETSRRVADDAPAGARDVFVLTGDMRADGGPPPLGAASGPSPAPAKRPPAPPPPVDLDGRPQPLDLGLVP
ncbi:MAG: hypothetical protein AAGF90_12370, partial [Pseudomonadota bacterium]